LEIQANINVKVIYFITISMSFTQKIQVNYHDLETGKTYSLPAIYTEKGLIKSHLRYLAWNHFKSESWKNRSTFSLRLLLTYINAQPQIKKGTTLLKSFTQHLLTGTIDYEQMSDPIGLYWKGRDLRDANNILFHITHYTDFLAQQEGYEASRINPFRKATGYEERLNWCAYYNKQANVFLNHLSNRRDALLEANRVRFVDKILEPIVRTERVVKFPDEHIDSLLTHGFSKSGQQDYKSQAITMLLNYGGLRKSEIFHLYVSDITLHPNYPAEALIRVYHPEYGASPDPVYKNRREYLLNTTSYQPRNSYNLTERLFAGWKSPLLISDDKYFEVIFNPPEKARDFLITWANYLKYQRVEPRPEKFHPFAFTNSKGLPETIKNFQRLHKRAVERIGLTCKKSLGTTEHGHRHAYGYRARLNGLSQVEIQKAMHHKSPLSSIVYTQPTAEEVRDKMRTIK